MKNSFLFIALIIAFHGFSQTRPFITHTEKGNRMIGGQVQLAWVDLFASETILRIDDDGTEAGIVISPNMGKFIENNWFVGGMVHLGLYTSKYDYKNNNTSSFSSRQKAFDIGFTPFTRYYLDITKRHNIKVFLQAGLPIIFTDYYSRTSQTNGSFTDIRVEDDSYFGLYGNWGGGASFHGKFGAIEANLSGLGLNIALQKFIGRRQ
jgi:hypothetical protein